MPISGFPALAREITVSSRPLSLSFFAASQNAPTPGRIIDSALSSSDFELVTTAAAPIAEKELFNEKRFPTP